MNLLKLILPIFLFQVISVHAQKKAEYKFDVKKTDKNLVHVSDSLYAYKYECSNYDYRVFLNDLISQGRIEEYKKIEVDSVQWRDKLTYNEPYVLYYHNHPAYKNYPVVNITHTAANAYRKWLAEKYNNDKNRKFKKVMFKLPSEYEWMLAANDGENNKQKRFPIGAHEGMFLFDKGKRLCNFLSLDESAFIKDSTGKIIYGYHPIPIQSFENDGAFYTAAVDAFAPTKIGLYNMAGNVAEMLELPGRTKGGSFQSVGGNLKIISPDEYRGFTHGQPQIGFRVFMKVLEK